MKLATFMMPLHPPGKYYPQSLREDREAIILADKLGFEEAFVGEHVTDAAETVTHCMAFLASLISDTKRIKLGTGTINIPCMHPAAIAAQVAMLDNMLEGRFIMGISPGGLISDAEVFGNLNNDRNAMFVEGIDMVLKIWESDPPYKLQGKFWNVTTEKTMIPEIGQGYILKPFQKPHPRILLSASNEESAEFVGQYDAILGMTLIIDLDVVRDTIEIYKKVSRAHGRDPGPDHILIGQQTCIAETDEEARHHMREALPYFHDKLMRPQQDAQRIVLQKSRFFSDDEQKAFFVKRLQTHKSRSLEDQIEAGSLLCGSPQSVVKQIKRLRQHLGAGHININMKIGTMPDEIILKGMDLFRTQVLPHVADL